MAACVGVNHGERDALSGDHDLAAPSTEAPADEADGAPADTGAAAALVGDDTDSLLWPPLGVSLPGLRQAQHWI